MPDSLISIARRTIEAEKHLTTEQQLEQWQGRREAARAWLTVCEAEVAALLRLEVNRVVEPTSPLAAGALPDRA